MVEVSRFRAQPVPRSATLCGPFGGNAVATNGILHDEVLARIGTA